MSRADGRRNEIMTTPHAATTHSVSIYTRDAGNGQNLGNAASWHDNLLQKPTLKSNFADIESPGRPPGTFFGGKFEISDGQCKPFCSNMNH